MKNSAHMGFWITIVFVIFLLSPLLRNGKAMEGFLKQEIEQTRMALGDKTAERIVDFASGLFEGTPLGVIAAFAKTAQHSKEDRDLSGQVAGAGGLVLSGMFNSYLQGLVMQAFIVAMRFAIAMVWILILAPFLIAAVHDGFMLRRIKRAEFGAIRPATFTIAGMVVIPMLALPLVYLVIPYTLSPLLAPAWAFVVALPLSLMVSNMQPIFGR